MNSSKNFQTPEGILAKLFTFYPKWKSVEPWDPPVIPSTPTSSLLLHGAAGESHRLARQAAAHRPTGRTGGLAEPPLVGYKVASTGSPSPSSFLLHLRPLASPWPAASELRSRLPSCSPPRLGNPIKKAPPQLPLASTRSSALLAQGRRCISSFSTSSPAGHCGDPCSGPLLRLPSSRQR